MTTMAEGPVRVTGGVDTHKHVHVAAALDGRGGLLGVKEFPATGAGHVELRGWLGSFGELESVGVEGTGSWGAGLCRSLQEAGVRVHEVGRPNRQRRRRTGKSDPADAVSAARSVQAEDGLAVPKDRTGPAEAARLARLGRDSLTRELTKLANQMHGVIDSSSSEALRDRYRGKTIARVATEAARSRPGHDVTDPDVMAANVLRRFARRWLAARAERNDIDAELKVIVEAAAPQLLAEPGIGVDVASVFIVSLSDNPERMATDAAAAATWGVSPVDASSGLHQRHRLNRGGDRQANRALYVVALCRMRWDPTTQAYIARRIAEGKTKKEAIRALKRHLARRIWRLLTQPPAPSPTS